MIKNNSFYFEKNKTLEKLLQKLKEIYAHFIKLNEKGKQ